MNTKCGRGNVVIVMFCVFVGASLCSCGKGGESESERDEREQTAKAARLVNELTQRHNADRNWYSSIDPDMYTIDLEDLLVSSTQPLVLMASILDLVRTDTGVLIVAWPCGYGGQLLSLVPNLDFVLECTPQQAQYIRQCGQKGFSEFADDLAIIFSVHSVQRARLQISVETDIEAEDSFSDTA